MEQSGRQQVRHLRSQRAEHFRREGTAKVQTAAERPGRSSSKVRTGQRPWIRQYGGHDSPKGKRGEDSTEDAKSSGRSCVMAMGHV